MATSGRGSYQGTAPWSLLSGSIGERVDGLLLEARVVELPRRCPLEPIDEQYVLRRLVSGEILPDEQDDRCARQAPSCLF